MMKKLIIISGWLISATATLSVCITTIHFLRKPRLIAYAQSSSTISQPVLSYKHILQKINLVSSKAQIDDARPILIAKFLEHYNSPLKPYDYWGHFFTIIAEKYDMDYRLLPSISMQESGLCKFIPPESHNCLGLGIHARGTWGFDTYESNFETAAKILKENYIDIGLTTPELIQTKYTPSSNGSWQYAVNLFMDKIESGKFD